MLDRPPNRFQQYATQTPASARFQIDTTGLQQHDMVDNRAKNVVDAILEGAKAAPSERARRLTYFNDCLDLKPKAWIIKNVMAKGETSSWYGPPMGMKSAILTDIAVHVSAAIEWREHGIKDRTGVAFFAFERATLTCRRLMAYAKRDGHTDLPIAICSDLIDLLSPTCVDIVVATIGDAATHFNIPLNWQSSTQRPRALLRAAATRTRRAIKIAWRPISSSFGNGCPTFISPVSDTPARTKAGASVAQRQLGDIDIAVQLTGSEVRLRTLSLPTISPADCSRHSQWRRWLLVLMRTASASPPPFFQHGRSLVKQRMRPQGRS